MRESSYFIEHIQCAQKYDVEIEIIRQLYLWLKCDSISLRNNKEQRSIM